MITVVLDQLMGLCQAHGITTVFQCPGSRNAPLTLAFERQKSIAQHTVFDERVAGYMALGHSLASQKAAIVHTTSGTAAYNLAPAVAEAFFAQVPLLVFTADRPSEWLGHQDGQMIHQQNIYGTHVKAFYQMPVAATHEDDIWAFQQIVNEAIMTAHSYPAGPVHLNFPFREPFYPKDGYKTNLENLNFNLIEEVKTLPRLDKYVLHSFVEQWQNTEN
jgi:2-succinyl-5-enolpyruvyl-6-hydroxy-3-cyclohexene-1-carboxylate synthase